MQKTNKKISLETDFTNIGFMIAIGVSILIIVVSILMIYISTPPQKIYAARVNGEPITLVEYKNNVERTKTQYTQMMQMDFNSPNGAQMLQTIEKNVVNGLVDKEVLVQSAKEKGIEVSSQEINDEVDSIKTKNFNGDEKLFNQTLNLNKITLSQLKEDIRKNKAVEKLKKQLTDEIKISEKDKKDYYEKNKAQYGQAEEVRASHILVKDQKLADDIYNQLKKGAKFEDLAKKYSTDPGSKDRGGDLDYFGRGRMVPEFEKTAFSLKDGEMSKPVKSNFGYHIIKRTGYKPAKQSSYEEVKAKVDEAIKTTKSAEVIEKYTKAERDKDKVEVFVAGDSNITPPVQASANASTQVQVSTAPATEKKPVETKKDKK